MHVVQQPCKRIPCFLGSRARHMYVVQETVLDTRKLFMQLCKMHACCSVPVSCSRGALTSDSLPCSREAINKLCETQVCCFVSPSAMVVEKCSHAFRCAWRYPHLPSCVSNVLCWCMVSPRQYGGQLDSVHVHGKVNPTALVRYRASRLLPKVVEHEHLPLQPPKPLFDMNEALMYYYNIVQQVFPHDLRFPAPCISLCFQLHLALGCSFVCQPEDLGR